MDKSFRTNETLTLFSIEVHVVLALYALSAVPERFLGWAETLVS